MTEVQPHHCISFLNMMMMSEALIESIEQIKDTQFYRHDLKAKTKLLLPELERVVEKDLARIWGVDDNAMYHLIEQQKSLIHRLSTTRPEVWSMINELLDMYDQDREGFLERNEIIINA